MPRKNEFKLNMVSVRLVKDAPVYSEHRIVSPEAAVDVMVKCFVQWIERWSV